MYNKAIVAIDGSENAKRAVTKAIELVKCGSISEVVVFHSIMHKIAAQIPPAAAEANTNPATTDEIPAEFYPTLMTALQTAGETILDEAKETFDAENVPVEARLITDLTPEDYIFDMTDKEGFDLVVLGCSGHHSRVVEAFLGTVPTRVLHASKSDVLVVH
jgi:nucleotide-binding universal stress UspA family protein